MSETPDYRPTSMKAEVHVTYECDLSCVHCNRASFLRAPHTSDMTLDDMREFLRQAVELDWRPYILLIGGEPTLHPDFAEFARLAAEFNGGRVQFWSNGYQPSTRVALERVRDAGYGGIVGETHKYDGSRVLSIDDIFVSPKDFGHDREPCFQHASIVCGISVDHDGYSPCAIGGMVDGILQKGFRTKRLADLFDREKVAEITKRMCEDCGHQFTNRVPEFRAQVDSCPKKFGARVSPTWEKAFEGRR